MSAVLDNGVQRLVVTDQKKKFISHIKKETIFDIF